MAQTGYSVLSLYYSATAAAAPTAGNLVAGELAINTNDGKLYYKDSSGVVQTIASKAGALGDVVGPASATDNAVSRFDATTGKLIQNSLVTISDTGAISAPVDASISGLTVGKGGGSQTTTTAVGNGALAGTNSGVGHNTGVGYQALYTNTTGTNLDAFGAYTLNKNTTGIVNTAMGGSNTTPALYNNTTGSYNVGLGVGSLFSNTTASNNTAVGYQAGYTGTTATEIAAFGSGTLQASTGSFNSAFGYRAAYSNTTGVENTVMGHVALVSNTTGSYNSAFGKDALRNNTTASNNTAVGYQAGYTNTTGTGLTLLGYGAGYTMTGNYNVAVGVNAGRSVTTGTYNTLIGTGAGTSITTGGKNTVIGAYDGNQGGLDIRTASNYIVLSDGDGNPRVITENNGNTLIGTTLYNDAYKGILLSQNGRLYAIADAAPSGNLNRLTSNGSILEFKRSGTIVGDVTVTTVATIYNTTSDYRLKTVIGSVKDSGQRLDALEPIEYDWKSGGRTRGFLAHQFAEVYPNSVNGEKDAVDEEGKPVYQGMQASTPEVMADLIAEIQSLRKRVALLESK